jgi:hypothetical protein
MDRAGTVESLGNFDAADYQRQVENGMDSA